MRKHAYYDRSGKEIPLLEWGRLFEDPEYKIVKQEKIYGFLVSTVWIGTDLGLFSPDLQIFETMIFDGGRESCFDYQERYSNEEQALKGHYDAVSFVKLQVKLEEKRVSQEAENG